MVFGNSIIWDVLSQQPYMRVLVLAHTYILIINNTQQHVYLYVVDQMDQIVRDKCKML